MDVAVVSSGHIPSQWAHSINTVKTANAFSKIGHNVEILTVERFLEKREKQKINNVHRFYGIGDAIKIVYFRDNPLFYFEEINSPIHYFYEGIKRITNGRIRYVSDPEKRISEYCKKNSMDVSYCRAYRTAYYNVKNGIPTILESHTPNTKHPELQRVIKLSHSEYFKGLVTISDILKQNFIAAGVPEDKVLVLDDGVDVDNFRNIETYKARIGLTLPHDKFIAMYSGHLYKGRGLEYILDAAKVLKNITFLIVGGFQSDVSHWKSYTSDMGLHNVIFTGFIENKMIPTYLKAADVLLMPYTRDTPTYRWMSPLKLFEYMAAGKPIIATDLEAIKSKIKDMETGILIREKSGEEIADAIALIMDNKALADKLSRNVEREAEKYSLRKRVETILKEFIKE